jgi:hypothetical protein
VAVIQDSDATIAAINSTFMALTFVATSRRTAIPGIVIITSAATRMMVSIRPPKKPAHSPRSVPMESPITPAMMPILSVWGVAATREARTSRPCVSVPRRWLALGGMRGRVEPTCARFGSSKNGRIAEMSKSVIRIPRPATSIGSRRTRPDTLRTNDGSAGARDVLITAPS